MRAFLGGLGLLNIVCVWFEWMGGWVGGWMDGWMEGWVDLNKNPKCFAGAESEKEMG